MTKRRPVPPTSEERRPPPADELAIQAALIQYGMAIDTKDWALLRACFTDDCRARYGELTWSSPEQLARDFVETHSPLDVSAHRVLNIAVVRFSGNVVSTRSYGEAVLIRRSAPGGEVLQISGIYTDTLKRSVHGWRIARRDFAAPAL